MSEEIDGLLAVCLQHEMDHLEGILFIDHLSRLKREMILRKIAKCGARAARRPPIRPNGRAGALFYKLSSAARQSRAHSRHICAHSRQWSWS